MFTYTRQNQIRTAFWREHPDLPRKRIKNYSGTGLMYPTDTRVAFCEFVDALAKNGMISEALADRVTLGESSVRDVGADGRRWKASL
jgi:hypothetical protein